MQLSLASLHIVARIWLRVFSMLRWFSEYWRNILQSVLTALGVVFLLIESYEVITDNNIQLSFSCFLSVIAASGITYFFLNGYFLNGFLQKKIEIPSHDLDTKIFVKFGNLFEEEGWKAVGASDFFDSHVDEDLVSSNSLHGHVINTFWSDNRTDWQKQINSSLKNVVGEKVTRSKGNEYRYPIGTTGIAKSEDHKFLFVALGETDITSNVTSANGEMLISAVRGMLIKARAVCSYEPLFIPLMGSGLARVGIKNSVILDLIITAILEESRQGRVTGEITVIVPLDKEGQINLKNHVRNWKHGK